LPAQHESTHTPLTKEFAMKEFYAALLCFASVVLVHAADAKIEWTTDLAKMKAPDAPVAGTVMGGAFKLDVVRHDITGALTLKQGKDVFGDASVIIFLPIKKSDELAGQKFDIETTGVDIGKRPHVHMNRRLNPKDLPKGAAFIEGYAMRLEFGEKKDGKIPGKIYLSMPDDAKTVIAGTFAVEVK
jgi:hypothetical protein